MGLFLFIIIIKFYIISTLVLSIFTFKGFFYFIADTTIIGVFFIIGSLDSWELQSWVITGHYHLYVLSRFIFVLIIFLVRYKRKNLMNIIILNKKFINITLIGVNIFINIITMNPAIGQLIGVSGV